MNINSIAMNNFTVKKYSNVCGHCFLVGNTEKKPQFCGRGSE